MYKWLMAACDGETLIRTVSKDFCAKFDFCVRSLPADLCAPFRAEAARLVDGVKFVSTLAGSLTREEEDLDKVAAVWKTMVEVCDHCHSRLVDLCQKHPDCGAKEFHDEILDLRNICARLEALHA